MAGSHSRNWYVVRSPTRFGRRGSAASTNFMSFSGGLPRSWKNTRSYRRWGIGAWPRWTMRSTGISATSHAPNEGSAETRHMTPAFVSISRARSTAVVLKPTGNCRPTVFALRPRMTSRRRSISSIVALPETRHKKKLFVVLIAKIEERGPLPPSNLSFLLLPFDLEPPGRRQLHATFPQGLFRVVDVILRRRDREDLHARFDPRRRADGRPERSAHAFGNAVRPGPRGDFVLAEHVVRIQSEL